MSPLSRGILSLVAILGTFVLLHLSLHGIGHFFRYRRDTADAPLRGVEPVAGWGLPEVLVVFAFSLLSQLLIAPAVVAAVHGAQRLVMARPYPAAAGAWEELTLTLGTRPQVDPLVFNAYVLALSALATVVLVCLLVGRAGGSPLSTIGLHRFPTGQTCARLVVLLLCFLFPCFLIKFIWVLLLQALGHEPENQVPVTLFLEALERVDAGAILALVIGAVLVAPVIEEVLYRGFLHTYLSRRFGFFPAAAVSALVFSLVHITPSVYLPVFLLGFLLSAVYERRGSLYDAILFHALFNFFSLLSLAALSLLAPELVT